MPNKNALDLINDVFSRLAEGQSSTGAALTTGAGGIAVTANATVLQYLNDGSNELCRGAYPIYDTATYTIAANGEIAPFENMTLSNNLSLWCADEVVFGSTYLEHADISTIRTYYHTWKTEAAGTPKYWYEMGNDGIGIWPKPSASSTVLTIPGLALPKQMNNSALVITTATNANPIVCTTASAHNLASGDYVNISGALVNTAANGNWAVTVLTSTTFSIVATGNGSYTASSGVLADIPTWFIQDALKYIVYYAAAMYASKNLQRGDLAQRAGVWMGQFEAGKQRLLTELWAKSPEYARAHFARPATG